MRREEKELKLQLKKAESKHDLSKQLELCNELGSLSRSYGNIEDAKDYYRKGVQISEIIHADFDGSYSHRALCEIFAEEDLQQALSWCEKSIEYIKTYGHKIDGNLEGVKSGGNAARRKAGLVSGWCLTLKWTSVNICRSGFAQVSLLILDCAKTQRSIGDQHTPMLSKLCNIATPKRKGPALMELGQALMYAGDMIGAQSKLLECLAKYKSSLTIVDTEILEARIVFLYEYLYRLRKAENKETPRKIRRKMYEKIADSLCDYTRERKDLLKMALKFYEKMLFESVSDKEKHPALISLAETAADIGDYSVALDYYGKVLILEQNMSFTQAKITETKVALFLVQCRGQLLSKTELLNQFDYLTTLLSEEKTSLKVKYTLVIMGYNVNMRDYGGWTPLSEAVSAGVRENVRLLLRNKAHVDCVSREKLESDENSTGGGITPLMEACDKGLIDIARDLLKFGASVVRRNQDGWTAVDFLRNMIIDLDDEVEIREAQNLAEDMEEMQRKLSFAVRNGPPPKRQIHMEGTATRKVPARRFRSVSPGKQNLNTYKKVISRLGGQTTLNNEASEVGLFDDDLDSNVRDRRRVNDHLDEIHLEHFYNEDFILETEQPHLKDNGEVSINQYSSSLILLIYLNFEKRRRSNESSTSYSSRISSEYQSSHREDILPTSLNHWRTVSHVQNASLECETVGDRHRKRRNDDRNEKFRKRRPLERTSKSRHTSPVLLAHQTISTDKSPLLEVTISRRSQDHDGVSDTHISNTAPNNIICTTPSLMNLLVTLKFQNEMGEPLRVDKLVAFPRASTMSAVFARFKDELPAHQQSFDVFLADGRENLDVVSALQRFDISGSLDISSVELNNHSLTSVVFSAVTASNRNVQEIIVDYCELDSNAAMWISEIITPALKFSAKACGLIDEHLDIISKVSAQKTFTRTRYKLIIIGSQGLHNIEALDLSYNSWLGVNGLELILNGCEKINQLILSGCNLDGITFSSTWLPHLRHLSLVGCQMQSWDSLLEWISLGCVEFLDLSCTSFSLSDLNTLITSRLKCPPIVVRLARCQHLESDPRSLLDFILPHIGSDFSLRFSFSSHFFINSQVLIYNSLRDTVLTTYLTA
uniref:ANK_REP_REGION domain-containing protein n=1 Tax=Heterorhabditis bacteriophora TaxID=37862 RepID=A0A1I7XE78_HETBA